jgi:hypothetical protein
MARAHVEAVLAADAGDKAAADDAAHEMLTLAAAEAALPSVIAALETIAAIYRDDRDDRFVRLVAAAARLRADSDIGSSCRGPADG